MADRQPDSSLQQRIEAVIRDFPFDNYGLNDVDIALHDYPDDQEWVPALARRVLTALDEAVDV
ncbi:hypothetical protein [Streptomyces antimycoticus]|uniref:hypothetical protein n=1 Tax=Streptomyces antimycoticus TaxID=68175 RepID=UPI003866B2E2|nr:hypothetical protein OG751_04000 [Streptomyces antimycoticus]